jgi:hypothetical protein
MTRGSESIAPFLTSTLDAGELSGSRPGNVISEEENADIHWREAAG